VGNYEGYENLPHEIIQVGDDVVLVINTLLGHLPGSSESLRPHNAYVFRFQEGLILHWTGSQDIDGGPCCRRAACRVAGVGGVAGEY